MNWFTIGAAAIAALFVLNALVYVLRTRKLRVSSGKSRAPLGTKRMAGSELAVMVLVMAPWGASFLATVLAPESVWGKSMSRPWALASLFLWLLAGAVVIVSVYVVLRRRSGRAAR